MEKKKFKVIVLTHGGAGRLLELLSGRDDVEVGGVFLETVTEPKRPFTQKIRRSIRYDGYTQTLSKLILKTLRKNTMGAEEIAAVRDGQNEIERIARKLKIPFQRVENYHTAEAQNLLRQADADLGIIYGTNIIKESVFGIPRLGSVNLHQGLAPHYRGGPTVFWELLNGESEIGVTIHFVAAKVDTGDIVVQKTFPLEYDFSRYGLDYNSFLADFRSSLTEPSARMMVEAVSAISDGSATRVEQDTSVGRRYRLPTKKEKDALVRALKQRMKQRETKRYAY